MPAICAVWPLCKSCASACCSSSSFSSSSSSGRNAVERRKKRRLIPIAISRYAGMVISQFNAAMLASFNASRMRSDVHFLPLWSRHQMWPDAVCRSCINVSTCCWNGKTNHKYRTNNSPTSCGKYRWMILVSPFNWYPLWYLVTNTTMPSSINTFLWPPFWVLLCLTLKISVPRAGCPPIMG